ncbi:hypothetical protein [Geodermatophilus obscurus]|uniref:hypothetical protein n=1 Tax=Geodermatophilus obscurus TaxID=1861 RepID=UPI001160375B|nr:hypothetical protein [Geodermatophilus obscurus]
MSWEHKRARALEAVQLLGHLLRDAEVDERRLTLGYLDAKRELAAAFETLAKETYADDREISRVKHEIEVQMRRSYPAIPLKYLQVKRFYAVHALILNYLSARLNEEIAADELRLLSGDAVHTERRARELRDLGLNVVTRESGGVATYRLTTLSANLQEAAEGLTLKNINADARLPRCEREAFVAHVLSGRGGGGVA